MRDMDTRSHFVPQEPIRISLPDEPDEWIAIRPKLSVGQKTALEAAMIEIRAQSDKSELQVSSDIARFLNLQLETFIVGWHLKDREGNDVPFSPERIKDLDPDDPLVVRVIEEIAARSPFGTKKTSGGGQSL